MHGGGTADRLTPHLSKGQGAPTLPGAAGEDPANPTSPTRNTRTPLTAKAPSILGAGLWDEGHLVAMCVSLWGEQIESKSGRWGKSSSLPCLIPTGI